MPYMGYHSNRAIHVKFRTIQDDASIGTIGKLPRLHHPPFILSEMELLFAINVPSYNLNDLNSGGAFLMSHDEKKQTTTVQQSEISDRA
jgi:hypothetical protein